MPNRTYANEWLEKARRHLETAELLFREDHYTDIIAISDHYQTERYPGPNYSLPVRTEIGGHLETCQRIFKQISNFINKV
ncbi:MAG: HEPN domain-containing protein [Bacteroidales bacterium]|nr:HEPN domain-containing protein [Bacteroidales bacterium]